ncbi:MAG: hypothetical protein Q7S22_02185 [Candidatus Micrarchaeota archaeon]|nr:hypothetical protein [Candidatus Micrarchaeota archaeon]
MDINGKELEKLAKEAQQPGEDFDEALLRICKQKYAENWEMPFKLTKISSSIGQYNLIETKINYQSRQVSCEKCNEMNEINNSQCTKCGTKQDFLSTLQNVNDDFLFLENIKNSDSIVTSTKTVTNINKYDLIICSSCHAKNKEANLICVACGYKLKKGFFDGLKALLGYG